MLYQECGVYVFTHVTETLSTTVFNKLCKLKINDKCASASELDYMNQQLLSSYALNR